MHADKPLNKNNAVRKGNIDTDIFVNCKWVDTRWQ